MTLTAPMVGVLCACNISSALVVLACCMSGQQGEASSKWWPWLASRGALQRYKSEYGGCEAVIRRVVMEGDLASDAD